MHSISLSFLLPGINFFLFASRTSFTSLLSDNWARTVEYPVNQTCMIR